MLGRRAALGTSIVALAIAGGGGAIAASQDSSPSTKPKAHKVVPHQAVVKKAGVNGAAVQKAQARSGHNCPHERSIASSL